MFTLGLIGGIGSGKSTVASLFARLGAGVVDADAIGHRVLTRPEVKETLRERWGNDVFLSNGELDRKAVAATVFTQTEDGNRKLEFLTDLTHPLIQSDIAEELHRLELAGTAIAVLDAALLLETDWKTGVDRIVFVDAPRNIRLQRILQRNWTETQLDAREAMQLPLEFKKSLADWIIDNSRTMEETLHQIETILGPKEPGASTC